LISPRSKTCRRTDSWVTRSIILSWIGLEQFIDGVILFDESLRQTTLAGVPCADHLISKGIAPGIKVDGGFIDMAVFPGEKISKGLDGLGKRLEEYYQMGARFTKWRALITIGIYQ
jgi:fructose-bisphosphate aldolase class I